MSRVVAIEATINEKAFSGNEAGLMVALTEYRGFFREMVMAYGQGEQGSLFGRKDG